jgi:hypothetical protein
MQRIVVILSMLVVLAISTLGQTQRTVSWDGYVQRGRVKVRAGGSGWSVNGESASHTEEIYESAEMARYILTRLRGKMRSASEIVPNAGSVQIKVTQRHKGVRIAWVCGTDLHYFESKSYAAVVTLLSNSNLQECN